MVPRPYQETAAKLARALADSESDVPREPEPPVLHSAPHGGRLVWPFVALLLGILAAVAGVADVHRLSERPGLLALLVVSVVALDLTRIDVFERINLSPASVPSLALGFLFGPVGPILAELAIAVVRIARRVPAVKWAFDVGALGLAGAAAAAVWSAAAPGPATAEIAVGVLAALASYLVTSLLLPVVIWLARGDRPLAAWREQLAWLWPHYIGFGLLAGIMVEVERRIGPSGVLVFAVPVFLLWIGEQQYLARSRAGVTALRERNAQLEDANERIRDLYEHAHVSYLQAITTLGHALQARDPDAAGRTERVTQLSAIIATAMDMPDDERDAMAIGVVVHDIGRALLRPREDPALVPALSAQILDPLDLPPVVKAMARHHLERFDGIGGPDALRGEAIPLAARIVAVADALDHRTTKVPLREALQSLRDEAGTAFCPEVVGALDRSLAGDPTLRRYFGERPGDGLSRAA